MGQNIMWNWDLREFHVRVNLPSLIWHIRFPIWHVTTPIRGLPNSITHLELLLTHICSYRSHDLHVHFLSLSYSSITSTSIAEHKDLLFLAISPSHDHELTPSTSIHQVQNTPSTEYTKYSILKIVCLPFIFMITSSPLNVASASGVPPCTINCHQPASHDSSKAKSPCHICTFPSPLTDESSLSTRHTIHRPCSSTRPISLDHSVQIVCPMSHYYGLQVHLRTFSIAASKCISKYAQF